MPVDQLAELDEGETSKPTVGQLSLMFSNAWGERLRFNQLTEMMEFDGRELPEELVNLLYVQLSQADIGTTKNAAIDAILFAAMGNGYHPIREYFDALLADDDIKPADIDTLATTYLGTSDPLYDAMLAGMVIGARSSHAAGDGQEPRMTSDQRNHPRLARQQTGRGIPAINLGSPLKTLN